MDCGTDLDISITFDAVSVSVVVSDKNDVADPDSDCVEASE